MVLPQRLEALYSVAVKAAEHFSPPFDEQRVRVAQATKLSLPGLPLSAQGVFDPCGLILEIPPIANYMWCTPNDALTFAHTGGDWVHYSYLSSEKIPSSVVPVVMTLPASDKHNVVLAESIDEFLGLGYHVGWFSLESVVYEPEAEAVLQYFAQPDPDAPDYKSARMEFLRSQMGIRRVVLSLERIAMLTERYASFLVVPDEPPA